VNLGRPLWAEISRSTLAANFREIQRRAAPAEVCAVIKCNAYGHGAVECAKTLEAAGANWFAVTSPEEGIELRHAGISQRILLLSGFWREQAEVVVKHSLTPSVWESEHLDWLPRYIPEGERFPIHIEIDTGMSRQGVPAAHARSFIERASAIPQLEIEGIYQHYATGEDCGEGPRGQEETFAATLAELPELNIAPKYLHLCNSGATIARTSQTSFPSAQQLVRCGIALYGYWLDFENPAGAPNWNTQPALSWKTRVISLRDVPAGTRVGYSGAYTTTRATRIASLAVGYGDGLNRLLSSRGHVLLRGSRVPIIGNVSMDVTLIDVTDVPGTSLGDEVVLIGIQGEQAIDAWDHARLCGTIPYEILCAVGARVPRIHIE